MLNRQQFLSLYLPAISLSLGTSMIAPVIPVLAREFDVGFGTASLVLVAYQAGTLAGTFPGGYLIDRAGRRPVLLAGLVIAAASAFLTPFTGSFLGLLVLRFLGGVAMQFWQQARLAVITDTTAERQRARQVNWMYGMSQGGHLFGPSLGGFLAAGIGLWVPFVLQGVLCLLSLIPTFVLIRETAPNRAPTSAREGARLQDPGWRGVFAYLLTGQMLIFLAVQFSAQVSRGGWDQGALSLYAVYAYGIGPEHLGVLNTVAALVGLPVPFVTGYLMDRFSRKTVIVPGFGLYGVSLVAAAATAFLELPLAPFLACYVFVQASLGTTGGTMQVLGADRAPAFARGRFFGIWRTVSQGGATVSPGAFALVAEAGGYGFAFLTLSACAFAVAGLVGLAIRDPRPETTSVNA